MTKLRGDWKVTLRLYAEALGRTAQASAAIADYDDAVAGLRSKLGDRIFHFTYDTGDGKGTALQDDVLADPLWQSLSAVREGRAHAVSDAIWNTAGGIIAARLMLRDIADIYGVE